MLSMSTKHCFILTLGFICQHKGKTAKDPLKMYDSWWEQDIFLVSITSRMTRAHIQPPIQ
jgi:hypothetical protein